MIKCSNEVFLSFFKLLPRLYEQYCRNWHKFIFGEKIAAIHTFYLKLCYGECNLHSQCFFIIL